MIGQKKSKKIVYWGGCVLHPTQNCRKIHYDDCKELSEIDNDHMRGGILRLK